MAIDFELTPEQQRVKEQARELADDFRTRALQHDEERSLPVENFARLRDEGLYGIALPKELGGLGVGQIGWTAFAEELAQGDASTALAFNIIIQEANWSFGAYAACYLGVGLGIVEWAKGQLSSRTAKGYEQVMGYATENSLRFGQMVTEMEAARLMVYRAAWQTDTQPPGPDAFKWWVRAKLAVGSAVQRVSQLVTVACGVHSLFKEQGLELKLRDATTAPIMAPNSDACSMLAGLLTMGLDPFDAPSIRLAAQPQPAAV